MINLINNEELVVYKREGASTKFRNVGFIANNVVINNNYGAKVQAVTNPSKEFPVTEGVELPSEQTGCDPDRVSWFLSAIEEVVSQHDIVKRLHSMSPPSWPRVDVLTTHRSRLKNYGADAMGNFDFAGLRGSPHDLSFVAEQTGMGFVAYQTNAIVNLMVSNASPFPYDGDLKSSAEAAAAEMIEAGLNPSVIVVPYGSQSIPEQLGLSIVPLPRHYEKVPFICYEDKVLDMTVMYEGVREDQHIYIADMEAAAAVRYVPGNLFEFHWYEHPSFDGDNLGLLIRMNYGVSLKNPEAVRSIPVEVMDEGGE